MFLFSTGWMKTLPVRSSFWRLRSWLHTSTLTLFPGTCDGMTCEGEYSRAMRTRTREWGLEGERKYLKEWFHSHFHLLYFSPIRLVSFNCIHKAQYSHPQNLSRSSIIMIASYFNYQILQTYLLLVIFIGQFLNAYKCEWTTVKLDPNFVHEKISSICSKYCKHSYWKYLTCPRTWSSVPLCSAVLPLWRLVRYLIRFGSEVSHQVHFSHLDFGAD